MSQYFRQDSITVTPGDYAFRQDSLACSASDTTLRQTTMNNGAEYVKVTRQQTITSDAKVIANRSPVTLNSDCKLVIHRSQTLLSDAKVVLQSNPTITSDGKIVTRTAPTLLSDSVVKHVDIQNDLDSDSKVVLRSSDDILSDTDIATRQTKTLNSDTKVVSRTTHDLVSDAKLITLRTSNDIQSDTDIATRYQKTLQSDAKMVGSSKIDLISDAKVVLEYQNILNSDSKVVKQYNPTINSDTDIATRQTKTISEDSKIVLRSNPTLPSDTKIVNRLSDNLISDAWVYVTYQHDLDSDATILSRQTQTITSSADILVVQWIYLTSDSKVVHQSRNSLVSDSTIRGSKIFYGKLNVSTETSKEYYSQLVVTQPTPTNPSNVQCIDLKTGEALDLTWTDTGNYGYNIYKSVGVTWEKQNTDPIQGTMFIVGSLVTNVHYTFKITGVNGQGDESSGVQISGIPTFDITRYKNPSFKIYIDGNQITDAVLSTVELVYGPAFSTANFFIPKRPDLVSYQPTRQIVTVYINNRKVFGGYLVRREDAWTARDLRVTYQAVSYLWALTWHTHGENLNEPSGSYQPGITPGQVLAQVGSPGSLGGPIIYAPINCADMTILEVLQSMIKYCGNYQIYTDVNGNTSTYLVGNPVTRRTYEIGKHIVEERLVNDITEKIDQVTVYGSRIQYSRYIDYRMGDTIVAYSQSDSVIDQSEFSQDYWEQEFANIGPQNTNINFSWNLGAQQSNYPNFTGNINDLQGSLSNEIQYGSQPQYVQDQQSGQLYILWMLNVEDLAVNKGWLGRNISNVQVWALTNKPAEAITYAYFTTEQGNPTVPIEIHPSHVGLTSWSDGSAKPKLAVASYRVNDTPTWTRISAQIVYSKEAKRAYIVVPTFPVRYSSNIRQRTATFTALDGQTWQMNVTYLDAPNQYVADLRVTYTFEGNDTGELSSSQGGGLVSRTYHEGLQTYDIIQPPEEAYATDRQISNSNLVQPYLHDKAAALYSRLSLPNYQGNITVLGDETLDLRTQVNGLEVIRVVHDFSSGYLCHIDLTRPQFFYGEAVIGREYTFNTIKGVEDNTWTVHTVDYNKNWIRFLSGELGTDKLTQDPGTSTARYSD